MRRHVEPRAFAAAKRLFVTCTTVRQPGRPRLAPQAAQLGTNSACPSFLGWRLGNRALEFEPRCRFPGQSFCRDVDHKRSVGRCPTTGLMCVLAAGKSIAKRIARTTTHCHDVICECSVW